MSASPLDRLDVRHYPAVGRMILPDPVVGWIAAGEGEPSDNLAAFQRYRLLPTALRAVGAVSTATSLLGAACAAPIGIAPIAIQRAIHPDGELAMASGARQARSAIIVPVNATTPIGEIAQAEPDAVIWFQLYNWPDRDALARVVAEAEAAGCRAIVPLVNTPLAVSHAPATLGFRLPVGTELAHGAAAHGLDPGLDWTYLEWLATRTQLPIVPKGILHPADAVRALDAGAAALIVSNHGGRQVPRAIATLDALPGVVAAVGGRADVYLDGGVRSGTDVLIALALGARAVFVGRPACWGLAVGGADGVARVLRGLAAELASEAGMCGIADTSSIPPDLLVRDGT